MKKFVKTILLLLILSVMVSGCVSFPSNFPEQGIWYSSELDMYIDAGTETGYKMGDHGAYIFFHYHRDYGIGIHFVYCAIDEEHSADLESFIENAQYSMHKNILTIEFLDSGKKYEYIRVEDTEFPTPKE